MLDCPLSYFNEKLSKVVEFMTYSENNVKVFDTNLIYSMVIEINASS